METKLWLFKGLNKKRSRDSEHTQLKSPQTFLINIFSTNIHLMPIIGQALCEASYPYSAQIPYSQQT